MTCVKSIFCILYRASSSSRPLIEREKARRRWECSIEGTSSTARRRGTEAAEPGHPCHRHMTSADSLTANRPRRRARNPRAASVVARGCRRHVHCVPHGGGPATHTRESAARRRPARQAPALRPRAGPRPRHPRVREPHAAVAAAADTAAVAAPAPPEPRRFPWTCVCCCGGAPTCPQCATPENEEARWLVRFGTRVSDPVSCDRVTALAGDASHQPAGAVAPTKETLRCGAAAVPGDAPRVPKRRRRNERPI